MRLRDYQQELVRRINDELRYFSKAPLTVLPTGGGKTFIAAQVTLDHVSEGKSVWFIAHRQELIAQASRAFSTFGIRHGIVKSGQLFDASHRVQVASMQTLVRRLDSMPTPDLLIWDECHHCPCATAKKIISAYPNASLLGVTATPCRMNGAGLGDVFDSIILGPTNQWLTDNGFLSPARYYAPPQKADISKVHTRAGDYITSELEEIMDDGEITGDAVSHYKRLCDGVPMLVFCVSVAHAHHVAEEYRAAGYRAAAVDGKLSDEDRADRIGGLGTGKYQVITSCDLIGEGLDVPVVSAVQLLRPTQSPALHLQQIGRGLRPAAGKSELIVLDHVGNTRKHGFASTEREWTLEGKKKSDALPAVRTCSSCYSVHRTAKTCPYCGFEYPVVSRELTAKKIVDGELVEVVQTKEERRAEEENATTFAELVAIAKSRGYKKPHFWAMKRKKKWVHTGLMPRH
jgi:superfamily II DNA or RNA helicase